MPISPRQSARHVINISFELLISLNLRVQKNSPQYYFFPSTTFHLGCVRLAILNHKARFCKQFRSVLASCEHALKPTKNNQMKSTHCFAHIFTLQFMYLGLIYMHKYIIANKWSENRKPGKKASKAKKKKSAKAHLQRRDSICTRVLHCLARTWKNSIPACGF